MDNTITERCVSPSMMKSFIDYRTITFQMFTNVKDKTFDLMESYIKKYYNDSTLEAIDELFFERFYSTFLPLYSLKISFNAVEDLSREWGSYIDYICQHQGINLQKGLSSTSFNRYQRELQRIYYLIKEVRKYGEVPVLCWEPFIIDIKCYKNMKSKENAQTKYVVFEQGYFVLQDKIGNNIIFSKDLPQKSFYKVKIEESLSDEMKIGDIIQMSIKRKIFCTAWNIVNVKAYFNENARVYLNLGGNKV